MLKKLKLCLNTTGAAFSFPISGTISEHKMTKPRYWSREASLSLGAADVLELVAADALELVAVAWSGLTVTTVIDMHSSNWD
jgi:hypothetical protein